MFKFKTKQKGQKGQKSYNTQKTHDSQEDLDYLGRTRSKFVCITDTSNISQEIKDGFGYKIPSTKEGKFEHLKYQQYSLREKELLLINGIENRQLQEFINKTKLGNSEEDKRGYLTLDNLISLMQQITIWEGNNINGFRNICGETYSQRIFYEVYTRNVIINEIEQLLVRSGREVNITNFEKVYSQLDRITDGGITTHTLKYLKTQKVILNTIEDTLLNFK